MRRLYINQSNYTLYQEEGRFCRQIGRRSFVLAAALEQLNNIYPHGDSHSDNFFEHDLVFFEEQFDPIARIKRGCFYKKSEVAQPRTLSDTGRSDILLTEHMDKVARSRAVECFEYEPFQPTRKFNVNHGLYVFLGSGVTRSRWNVLHVDYIHTREEIYTLQLARPFLNFPELDETKIPEEHYKNISEKYIALIDDLNAAPESVVDHCRDFVVMLFIAKLEICGKLPDLGDLLKQFDKRFSTLEVVKNCGLIINRLHPRRKPNERVNLRTNPLTQYCADLALRCALMVVKELDWAK